MGLISTIKEIKKNHKVGIYIIIAMGVIVPVMVSVWGNPEQSVFFIRLILCIIIYWLFIIPSVVKIFFVSRFLLRIAVVVGVLFPLILSVTVNELEILNKYYPKVKISSSRETQTRTTDWKYLFENTTVQNKTPSLTKSYEYASTVKWVDVFIFFSALTWISILILLWIYDGYVLSKGERNIST